MSSQRYVCRNPDDHAEHCNGRHETANEAKLCRNFLRHATRQTGLEFVAYESVALRPAEIEALPQTTMSPMLLSLLAEYRDGRKPKARIRAPKRACASELGRAGRVESDNFANHNHDRGYLSDTRYHGDQFQRGEW